MVLLVGLLPALSQAATVEGPAKEPESDKAKVKPDENRVLVTVDGLELKAWQAEAMIKYGASRDLLGAVNLWIEVQTKANEARRLALNKGREISFILDLYRDYFFSGRVFSDYLNEQVPKATQEQALKKYQEDLQRYKRPFTATVRHIRLQKRNEAQKVFQEAQQPGADFDKLHEKYFQGTDPRKGMLNNMREAQLQRELGAEAVAAIKKAKKDQVLGPFLGVKGFEVVKVVYISPAHKVDFLQVQDSIKNQLDRQAQGAYREKVISELKAKAKIVKSAEVEKLEAAEAEKKKQATKAPAVKPAPTPPTKTPGTQPTNPADKK
jgi:hypothetical protein